MNSQRDGAQADVQLDKEAGGGMRHLTGKQGHMLAFMAVALSVFSIYVNAFTNIQEIYRNAAFLGMLFMLTFLLYPATKRGSRDKFNIFDLGLLSLGLIGVGYILYFYSTIHGEQMSQGMTRDYIFAVITILLLIEAARRSIGFFIPVLSVLAILYALFGPYLPSMFAHAGFSIERLLYRMYMTTEGVFGLTLSIASTYIVLFILFGAFLGASGASRLFNDLAIAIAGQRRGGPAQVAVLSSSLTGSLNGSAVANVATTGSFTIPLMKGIGLKPRFAGAVEAAASTGGMMMPPIMGAAAFIMAGFLGISYLVVILAAIIPTILYYVSLMISIDLEAKKQGLKGMSKESIPQVWEVLKERGMLLLPIMIVIGSLLMGRTPLYAGFAGIVSVIVASWLTKNKDNRITLSKAWQALVDGAKGTIQVGIACASIGIIIAVVTMTGLGSAIAYNVLALSGGVKFVILLLVMLTCIVLSMGLPSTALYIVVAVTAAPALIEADIHPVAAHFFVFWFGVLSNITPPVALASYTAAGIAGADAMKTSWTALRLTLPGFIIPFMIAYNPVMVMQSESGGSASPVEVILTLVTGLIGVFALCVAVNNYLSRTLFIYERIGFASGSFLLIKPGLMTDMTGFAITGVLLLIHWMSTKRKTDIDDSAMTTETSS
ncbi:TRAP transporter permease [Caldalkalibacillus salinus]|uniref:TRAP transporter permease n=1 Tax=Caldalkalibacillus salinus TaxID=2803787 RepID=UPI001924B56A|nr:TRAP transporter permease [Caldalkalibacillus salinus]